MIWVRVDLESSDMVCQFTETAHEQVSELQRKQKIKLWHRFSWNLNLACHEGLQETNHYDAATDLFSGSRKVNNMWR
jgi:hypothetical protein